MSQSLRLAGMIVCLCLLLSALPVRAAAPIADTLPPPSTAAQLPPGASPEWWAQAQQDIQAHSGKGAAPSAVDGLSPAPNWTVAGSGNLGYSLGAAGDVNGDGYADVIVGAYQYSNGEQWEGAAFVYLGGPAGLSTTPAWTAESNSVNAYFGYAVGTAGDVNGDGYSDVIIGAWGYTNVQINEGAAFVYYGSATGLGPDGTLANADWAVESNHDRAYFGYSVATAGDVNGDGYSDIIVGAYYYSNGELYEGEAVLWLGGAGGLSTAPAWTVESNTWSAGLGYSVATAGDVNHDGYADVIIGGTNRAFVYLGVPGGLSTTASWTAQSNQSDLFGASVGAAGDVNGDGYGDIIVGAPDYTNGELVEGGAFVWLGGPSGPGNPSGLGDPGTLANADWSAESNQTSADFGIAVGTPGDVNRDGYADIIIGARNYYYGAVFVYLGGPGVTGNPSGLGNPGTPSSANWTAWGGQTDYYFGLAAGGAGDVNHDGYVDVLVGSSGAAYAYYGIPDNPLAAHLTQFAADATRRPDGIAWASGITLALLAGLFLLLRKR